MSPWIESIFKRIGPQPAPVALVDEAGARSMPNAICLPTTEVGAAALVEEIVRVASNYGGQQAFKTAVFPCEMWGTMEVPNPTGAPERGVLRRFDNGKKGVEVVLPAIPNSAKMFDRLVANPQIKYVAAGQPLRDEPFEGGKPLTQVYVPFRGTPEKPAPTDVTLLLQRCIDALHHARYSIGWLVQHAFLAGTPLQRSVRTELLRRLKRSAAQLDLVANDGTSAFANCSVQADEEGFWLDVGDHVLATVEGKHNSLTTVQNWAQWVVPRLLQGGLSVQLVPTLQMTRWKDGRLGFKMALRGTIMLPPDPDADIVDDSLPPTHFGGKTIESKGRGPTLYTPNDLQGLLGAAFSGPKRATAVRKTNKPPASATSATASPGGSAAASAAAAPPGPPSVSFVPATPETPPVAKARAAPPPVRRRVIESARGASQGQANHQRRLQRSIIPRIEARARARAAQRRVIEDEAEEAEEGEEEDDEDASDADEDGNLRGFVVASDTEELDEEDEDPYEDDGTFRPAQGRRGGRR